MIRLSSTWKLPDGESPEEISRRYFEEHIPQVRRLPGLTRHVVFKAVSTQEGQPPAVWRGEDLWFDGRDDFDAAVVSPEWRALAEGSLASSLAGLKTDLVEVEVEYRTPDAFEPGRASDSSLFGRATWRAPTEMPPDELERLYAEVHVPNVRAVPHLHRQLMLKALAWPAGTDTRWWRGAEIWFASLADFQAMTRSPENKAAFSDGVPPLLRDLHSQFFQLDQEWLAA